MAHACKGRGFSRDSFSRFKEWDAEGGEAARQELRRRKPHFKNRVLPEVEAAVAASALGQPAWGQWRAATELAKRGLPSSAAGVRCVGKRQVMESVIETTAPAVRDFIQGIRGTVHVTCEEGTQAAWLYDILRPVVARVVVGDPRKSTLLLAGNKGDRVDAQKLAQLLRAELFTPVDHGLHGTRALKELARSYMALMEDCTRIMNRLKALYRARALPCTGEGGYRKEERDQWVKKLTEAGARHRAEWLYQELDPLLVLRDTACEAMITESRKHPAHNRLQSIAG